ncbi:hypothetical protein [Myxosarcina sp. GI1(2024)]
MTLAIAENFQDNDPEDVLTYTTTLADGAAIFVNAGGSAYTDSLGQQWSASGDFSGGSNYFKSNAIALVVQ